MVLVAINGISPFAAWGMRENWCRVSGAGCGIPNVECEKFLGSKKHEERRTKHEERNTEHGTRNTKHEVHYQPKALSAKLYRAKRITSKALIFFSLPASKNYIK